MSQEARTDGSYNNTVQIVEDGNQITFNGARPLVLSKYGEGHYRAEVRREFDLLKPYARALEIVGRDDERRSLREWLNADAKLSIRVLTGQGGSGKTRLALDLCDGLSEEDWQAGFIDGDDLKTVCEDASMVAWAWAKPTLVVVDYAATFGETLHRWLGRLVDHVKAEAPVLRILLLERQADEKTGWWQTVFGGGKTKDRAIQERLDPSRPIDIQALSASTLRREIFLAALSRSAEELKKEPPAVEDSEDFDNRLADLTWGGRPLFLMMAAMLAAQDGVPDVLALSRTDLAMDLAERELSRIGDAAEVKGLYRLVLETLAGYVTLCQGLERDALIEAVGIVQKYLHRSGDAGPIADLLRDQLPGQNGAAAILPDVIGEAAMLLALDQDGISSDLALSGFQQTGTRATASIIRSAQDFVGQERQGQEILCPLVWMDVLIDRNLVDVDLLMLIADQLPQTSRTLVEHRARLDGEIGRILCERVENGHSESLPLLAASLNNLATTLRDLGRRDDALTVAEEAVGLRRQLASERPDAFLPDLAMSLNNLANMLSGLGRREDALEATEETVGLRRKLAIERPDAFSHNLAVSLAVHANCLEALHPVSCIGWSRCVSSTSSVAKPLARRRMRNSWDRLSTQFKTWSRNNGHPRTCNGHRRAAVALPSQGLGGVCEEGRWCGICWYRETGGAGQREAHRASRGCRLVQSRSQAGRCPSSGCSGGSDRGCSQSRS
ncbi:MAG: tetratricopeptide repeat protein [Pseudomonadota bacterium]